MKDQMLRITGCSNSSYWYAGKIGAVVPILATDSVAGEYITREPSGCVNIVKYADAELVDVTPSAPECGTATVAAPVEYLVCLNVRFEQPQQLEYFDPKVLQMQAYSKLRDFMISRGIVGSVSHA